MVSFQSPWNSCRASGTRRQLLVAHLEPEG